MPELAGRTRQATWTEADRTEAELMGLVRDHDDHEAFATLLPRLCHLIEKQLRRVLPEAEIEDGRAEVALRVWHRRGKYREERGPVRVWVSAISRNHALDWLRRHSRRRAEIDLGTLADQRPDPAATTEKADWASHVRRVCSEVLASFPPDIRDSFELRLGGTSYATLAARTGRPLGTMASTLARVKARVLERINASGASGLACSERENSPRGL
jgi:RNA polymerase sigma-70 factor (ECF subfamily)